MTREEQIQKLIDEENGIDNYGSADYQVGVCDGVRLADETMIEKACKWLREQKEMVGISRRFHRKIQNGNEEMKYTT